MPKIIIVSGPYRSGSTWLFNALQEIARSASIDFFSCHSNELTDEIDNYIQANRLIIIKTHVPTSQLVDKVQTLGGIFFITCRDPRDCVSSLMTQFYLNYLHAYALIKLSCEAAVRLKRNHNTIVLKYEDKFTSNKDVLRFISRQIGMNVNDATIDTIFESLRPHSVRNKIELFTKNGIFDEKTPPGEQWHDQTHWHPNHIGDGAIKKYKRQLTFRRSLKIFLRNWRFFYNFGYIF